MQIHDVVNQMQAKRAELAAFQKEAQEKQLALTEEIQRLELLQRAAGQNVSLDDIEIASKIIEVYGRPTGSESREAVYDAITDLASGCNKLMSEYFGTKDYASFYDQRSDHPYGYGPKHGHIRFSVGLRRNIREALLNSDQGAPPTKEQFDACIRVLIAVSEGRIDTKLLGSTW